MDGSDALPVLLGGKDVGIFVVVPILLLLSQDPLLFRDLAEKRRYFPVLTALVVCLWWSSLVEIVDVIRTRAVSGFGTILHAHTLWLIPCLRDRQ